MPMPVSRTTKLISLGQMPGSTISATPPAEVNLMALPARLSSTCRNRAASPITCIGSDLDLLGLGARRQQFGDVLDHARQRERAMFEIDLAGLDLGIIQQLLDQ